jgi:hypothetical protein
MTKLKFLAATACYIALGVFLHYLFGIVGIVITVIILVIDVLLCVSQR